MLLAVCCIGDSNGTAIAEKLARRLDFPCCRAEAFEKAHVSGPCILIEEPGRATPAVDGLVRVLIHRGGDISPTDYDLTVDSGPLGVEATVELLSQFVALKLMSKRTRRAPAGGYTP